MRVSKVRTDRRDTDATPFRVALNMALRMGLFASPPSPLGHSPRFFPRFFTAFLSPCATNGIVRAQKSVCRKKQTRKLLSAA